MAESLRKMEEIEAQRIIAEQRKQMQQQAANKGDNQNGVATDTGLLIAPQVNVGESMEERVLKKSQVIFRYSLIIIDIKY
jgi:hypothetical protein